MCSEVCGSNCRLVAAVRCLSTFRVAAEGVVGVAACCGKVVVEGCCGVCAVVVVGAFAVDELEESPPGSGSSVSVLVVVGSGSVIICGVGSSSPVSSPVARGSQGVPLKCSKTVELNCSEGGSRRSDRVFTTPVEVPSKCSSLSVSRPSQSPCCQVGVALCRSRPGVLKSTVSAKLHIVEL